MNEELISCADRRRFVQVTHKVPSSWLQAQDLSSHYWDPNTVPTDFQQPPRNQPSIYYNRDDIHSEAPGVLPNGTSSLQDDSFQPRRFLPEHFRSDSVDLSTSSGESSLVQSSPQSHLSSPYDERGASPISTSSRLSSDDRGSHLSPSLQPATPWLDTEAHYEGDIFASLADSNTFEYPKLVSGELCAPYGFSGPDKSSGLGLKSIVTRSSNATTGVENVGSINEVSTGEARGCQYESHKSQETGYLKERSPADAPPCGLPPNLTNVNAANSTIGGPRFNEPASRKRSHAKSLIYDIPITSDPSVAVAQPFHGLKSSSRQSSDNGRVGNCSHVDVTNCNNEHGRQDNRCTSSQRKRRPNKHLDDQDGSTARSREGNGSSGKRIKTDTSEKQRIACPYMKRDPAEFSTWRTCPGPGFDGMHRMKEHLKRRHFKELSCPRCDRQFKTKVQLHEHSTAPTACEVNADSPRLGFMTHLQWDDIRARRGNGMKDTERWGEIYKILFPEAAKDQIPSLYHDVAEPRTQLGHLIDCNEYEAYFEQTLSQCIMSELDRDFQFMAQQAKQRLVRIVQQKTTETLMAFLKEKGLVRHGEGGASPDLDEGKLIQEDESLWRMIGDPEMTFQKEWLEAWM